MNTNYGIVKQTRIFYIAFFKEYKIELIIFVHN